MSAADMQFRTAAFGGFQKQDVIDYIEKNNREHAEQMEAVRHDLEEVSKVRDTLTEEKAEQEKQIARLTGEKSGLEEQLEALRDEKDAAASRVDELDGRLQELQSKLNSMQQELEETQNRIAKVEPAAVAYESLKDRTAGIELEAHQRAQGILNEAEQQADQTREDTMAWMQTVRKHYEDICAQLVSTSTHAAEELLQMSEALEGLNGEFVSHEDDLKKLVDGFQRQIPRMPEPLPLDD